MSRPINWASGRATLRFDEGTATKLRSIVEAPYEVRERWAILDHWRAREFAYVVGQAIDLLHAKLFPPAAEKASTSSSEKTSRAAARGRRRRRQRRSRKASCSSSRKTSSRRRGRRARR